MIEETQPQRRRGARLLSGLHHSGLLKWGLGGLLTLDLVVLLFALSFANVTSDGAAKRALGHSLAVLLEVDALLDDRYEALRLEAGQTEATELTIPDLPLDVSFTPEEVLAGDREAFRALLLTRAADLVHEEGVAALRTSDADSDLLSTQGAVGEGMDFLRPTPHRVLTILTIALASAAGAITVALGLVSRGYGRLVAVGLSALLAAAPFLILAVAVRFALRMAADDADDYLVREFVTLSQELAWAPIRNGIIFSVGAGVMLAAGSALALWSDGRRRA
jgi:hypothetical protein